MQLIDEINLLKNRIGHIVEERIREFEVMQNKDNLSWFHELCFCILTANTSAEMGIRVQSSISAIEFATLDEMDLSRRLREAGYRFYRTRAKYIVSNRSYAGNIKDIITKMGKEERREFLVKNIKGMGYKEASHFLRNVGYKDYAIIDKHIFRLMVENGLTREKQVNPKNYVELEKILENIARTVDIDLARLDLYLWYMETGKVLK
ncbi:MAG: N-glycosylase/DNA lyase [Thermoplasmata archaeon]|jgi:N-glycosylase/DNA lyase|nr:N-glycosylase/DNA lyase [Thermoplasmatales archaeon]